MALFWLTIMLIGNARDRHFPMCMGAMGFSYNITVMGKKVD